MIKAIRVLFVDDSEDDVLLLQRHFKNAKYHCHSQQVDDQDSLISALSSDEWDLVISDHNMPTLNSTQVVELVKNFNKNLPIIIVSGDIGEDVAIKGMNIGADDYIMKDNLKRLIPVVEREILGATQRRAHQRAESKLRHIAFHDPLTNLANRHEFNRRCLLAWQTSKTRGVKHVLIFMDLDQFKVINDTCGHVAGDELLMQLAVVLKTKIRGRDIIARLGGDEFGILLEQSSLAEGVEVAEKLKDSISDFRFSWRDKIFTVSVSMGIVVMDSDNFSITEALANADMACYAAKEKGRNRYEIFQNDIRHFQQRKGEMERLSEIRKALEENRFVLMSQPIVPVSDSSESVHHEMLIRMVGEDGKLIMPGAFIPAAERFNLMPDIDQWVVNSTINHIQKVQKSNGKDIGKYFVNLSGNSLSDDSFLINIEEKIRSSYIPEKSLCFEVTETAAIANLSNTIQLIEVLRKLNCEFALDDFGCGLSSFAYLKEIPLDYLKIDGGFVKNLLEDELDEAIVWASHHIGRAAKLKTIAEFVENKDILKKIKQIGIDFAQGWELGKPELLHRSGQKWATTPVDEVLKNAGPGNRSIEPP